MDCRRIPRSFLVPVVSLLALVLPACRGDQSTTITVTGSSTVAPLMVEIAKRYEAAHPGVRIEVQTGGSTRGLTDVRKGLAHIGMMSRALKPDENDVTPHTIARDGICMLVHKENAVPHLSPDQIRSIYRGEIRNWSQAGAHDGPITVVHKAEGRSTLEVFLEHLKLKNTEVKAHVIVGDNEQGIRTVAGNKDSIGYVSVGSAEVSQKSGQAIRCLDFAGVAATVETIKSGAFPLSRVLNLVTKGDLPKPVADLVAYAVSPAVNDLIQAQAFVPIH